MKISRRRLQQIIKEELSAVMEEDPRKRKLLQIAVKLYQDTKMYPGGAAKVVDPTGKFLKDLQDADKPNMGEYDDNESGHDGYNKLVDLFDNLHTQIYGDSVRPGEEELEYIASALAKLEPSEE